MGIIKASVNAIQGAAADQWKEVFCSNEMGNDLLMTYGKRMTGQRSANGGSGSVITDGSVIIVGVGECAIATEGGKIIGIYDKPGENIFKSNQSSGIFGGGVGSFIKDVGRRVSFGGDVTVSQRIYYINTKELMGGTIKAEGIPLRFKDLNTGMDIDGGVSCHGRYTFRIVNPELFYKAAIRTVDGRSRRRLLTQMDSEVLTALAPALEQMTQKGVRPSELLQYTEMLCEHLCQVMKERWCGLRGIEVASVALESVRVLDAAMFKSLQRDEAFKNPLRAAAHLTGAQADAIQMAAANEAGGSGLRPVISVNLANERKSWICRCGTENKGMFCTECGYRKPADTPKCGKCGWQPEDKTYRPKFCPNCGTKF